jgi:tRNA(Ile)-lysidine synthase
MTSFAGTFELLKTLIIDTKKIAVAVSGGADSMALTLILKDFAHDNQLELHALHVNHNLRPESACEAEQVKDWLASHGINCEIFTPKNSIAAMNGNLMQNARQVRYELMVDYCIQNQINYLATAHHRQDTVETYLMRLARGSGVDGLGSIKPITSVNGDAQEIKIIRPLLNVDKVSLQNYLRDKGQDWIEDPTNHNMRFTRTKMRQLIPILGDYGISSERIALVTQHLQRAGDFLQEVATKWIAQNATINAMQIIIPSESWLELHHEMQLRTLSYSLKQLNPQKAELRFEKLEYLRQKMLNPNDFRGQTLHHCQIRYIKGEYIISKLSQQSLDKIIGDVKI